MRRKVFTVSAGLSAALLLTVVVTRIMYDRGPSIGSGRLPPFHDYELNARWVSGDLKVTRSFYGEFSDDATIHRSWNGIGFEYDHWSYTRRDETFVHGFTSKGRRLVIPWWFFHV